MLPHPRGDAGAATACVAALLLAAVLLGHWPEVSGWLSADPLYFVAHLNLLPWDDVLPGQPGWNDPNAGTTTQALGALAARDWLAGVVPWWNPFAGLGLPLAAEMQNSALFLPFVLLLALRNGLLLLKLSLQFTAALATFALLRELGIRRSVAVVGAACFALNGTFAWMAHGPIMPVAFLPLLLLGIERSVAAARRKGPGGWLWIAVGLGYAIIAGFPETAFLGGMLAAAWTGLRLVQAPAPVRLALAAKVAAGGAVGLLLALPAMLPFLQLLPDSYVGLHTLGRQVIPRENVALVLTPYAYGPLAAAGQWAISGAAGGYLQLGLLPPALLGLVLGRRERALRWILAGGSAVLLAEAAGVRPVARVLELVPFLREIVVFRYVWPSWELVLVVLAALAIEDRQAAIRFGRRATLLSLAVCGALVGGGLAAGRAHLAALLRDAPDFAAYLAGSVGWAALVLASVGALLLLRPTPRRERLLGVALAAEAIALFSFTLLSGVRSAPLERDAVRFLEAHAGLARTFSLGPLEANYGAYFGIATINTNYLPVPKAWPDYVRRHLYPRADDIAYVPHWPVVAPGEETQALALRRRLPEHEAVGVKYVLADTGTAPFADMPEPPALRFRGRTVEIYELPAPAPYFDARGGPCTLAVRDRLSVAADCAGPAHLIRREMLMPGWTARVNGQRVGVEREGEIFQAVALPRGQAAVRFAYAPPWSGLAWAGFALGVAGLTFGILRAARRATPP
jgi:hypothetical protein